LAIRQLILTGQVDPRAPVQSYIPWFCVSSPQASAMITVQNLLDHRSGIPTSAGNQFYQLDEQYGLEELVRRARSIALTSIPGTPVRFML
jgi:CubicO group peptidase (beta-lactamase class C family)